jgi:hypothetical protein
MLQWVYDYLNVYLIPGSYQAIQMDTDSFYCAYKTDVDESKLDIKSDEFDLKYHPFEKLIRPELLDEWRYLVWPECNDGWILDYSRHFEPRRCCMKHYIHDQKTPFLFKLEASGTSMTALSSKTYCLAKPDGGVKYAAKGVKRTAIEQSRGEDEDQTHVFKKMRTALQTKTCGEPVANTTIRMDHKAHHMTTMTVTKDPYNSVYTKRKVCPNGIDTLPLSITLEPPVKRHNPVGFNPGGPLNRFPKPKLLKRKYTRKTTVKRKITNNTPPAHTPAAPTAHTPTPAAAAVVVTPAHRPPLATVNTNIADLWDDDDDDDLPLPPDPSPPDAGDVDDGFDSDEMDALLEMEGQF